MSRLKQNVLLYNCSSTNAKKWEVELSTLKSNNSRLTSALQESTANVEEWKRQLHAYKEENTRLKVGLIELEAGRGIATKKLSYIVKPLPLPMIDRFVKIYLL